MLKDRGEGGSPGKKEMSRRGWDAGSDGRWQSSCWSGGLKRAEPLPTLSFQGLSKLIFWYEAEIVLVLVG